MLEELRLDDDELIELLDSELEERMLELDCSVMEELDWFLEEELDCFVIEELDRSLEDELDWTLFEELDISSDELDDSSMKLFSMQRTESLKSFG